MSIRTAANLIQAVRDCGLVPPAEFPAVEREVAPAGDDPQAAARILVAAGRVTVHQLRKVAHGKSEELFVGPYVILDKIGEGGMGKVYKARDTRSGRVVGLKVVRPHLLTNPVVRGRFHREVQTARALKHKHVVEVFDSGEDAARHYLAMEFVDGIDLARLVREYGPVPAPEACEYLRQAALGLQHAHDQGVVHRDMKPSNIIVSGERYHPRQTGPTLVQILDMGLVRWVGFDEGGDAGSDLTRDGTVVGTPDYMAPEQAKNSKTIDHRADLYSLGGAFYFLLTGRPPFPDGSPIEKILKHQLEPPPRLQGERPDVSDDLTRLIKKLLAKKPDQRFQSAAELAEALAPFTRFGPNDRSANFRRLDESARAAKPPLGGGSSTAVPPPGPTAKQDSPPAPARKKPVPKPAVAATETPPGQRTDKTPPRPRPAARLHRPLAAKGEPPPKRGAGRLLLAGAAVAAVLAGSIGLVWVAVRLLRG